MPSLLVIDDEPDILLALVRRAVPPGVAVTVGRSGGEGLTLAAEAAPDVVLLDIQLPDMTGMEVYRQFRDRDARTPVVFLTGQGTTETAIEAMKLGAFDYLTKPVQVAKLQQVLTRALEISRMAHVPAVVAGTEPPPRQADSIVGQCPAMQEVYKEIGRVADKDVTVLILGETGTGKELVARALYHHGRRTGKPFLAINCAAIPEALLESELFGHEKGAFTGAERRRIGKFEQCDGGTLFLDEIGDMPLATQAKILRVIQDQAFERVGGNETIRVNVRLLAATHRDLDAMVAAGQFRRDLLYRLNVFTIRLPPLRARTGDLPLLARHCLTQFNAELGKGVQALAPETLAALERYPWPGNVREFQSVLKQALLQANGPTLLPQFLPAQVFAPPATAPPPAAPPELAPAVADANPVAAAYLEARIAAGTTDLYAEAQERMERALFLYVLQHTDGNQLQAARILGISRLRLRKKLRHLKITIGRTIEAEDFGDEEEED